jgi:hypothetical protein
MRRMSMFEENWHVASLRRLSSRHAGRVANARRDLAAVCREKAERADALDEALDAIRPPGQRLRITPRTEGISLLVLGAAESVIADSVVQALGLTATATDLVAAGVGGAATGLAWLVGHEWASSRDPQAMVAGARGWLRLAVVAAGAFLSANLGVRIYYGLLSQQASHFGSGPVTPLLSGVLFTVVTAVLMLVAAFISAHAETGPEARLRIELGRLRAELRSMENRLGVLRSDSRQSGPRSVADQGSPPAA